MSDASFSSSFADEDKGPSIILTNCVVVGISKLFVLGRLFVRGQILGKTHLDDHLTVLSLLLSYVTVGLEIWAVKSGNGRHGATLSPEQQSAAVLSTISGFPPNVLAYTVPKFAVVALLVRILNLGKTHRVVLWSLATGCLVLVLLCIVFLFAQCTPTHAQWDFEVTEKSFWSPWVLINVALLTGTYSAALDLYLAVYPATVLMKLQMNLKKKLILSIALGIGSISCFISIYKSTRLPSHASPDFTYKMHIISTKLQANTPEDDSADLVVWTVVEGNTLIIASCIPVMGPLVELALGRRVLSTTDRRYQKQSDSAGLRSGAVEMHGSLCRNGKAVGKSKHDLEKTSSQESKYDGRSHQERARPTGILRTDTVSVCYDSEDTLRRGGNFQSPKRNGV
ncbi:integral membrane protein [Colletotrichum musicola]|uniref:Integral membrane protein n=1 Tax=Colletotrichum musicola TaxID=2175873 RepID=A0A8H6N586_9PEZI|nr:integral membrane protein [Colletotrichum musicola]